MATTVLHPANVAERRGYNILHFAFVIAPLLAGIDKFANVLCDWSKYLAPQIGRVFHPHSFMIFVGIVEIIAAIIVWARPRVGAYIVAIWLIGIIVNLLMTGMYFDIALRDFGLLLGALAFAQLAGDCEKPAVREP